MNRFHGQTALIPGGTSGLGLAIARRLRAEGAFIVVFDVNAQAFPALEKEWGANVLCLRVDVTNEAEVQSGVAKAVAPKGRLDVLVNCAGITGKTNLKSHEVSLENFDQVLKINLLGSFLTVKHALPTMLAQKSGRVLHIASIAGKDGNAGMLAYSASKAAVIGMTKVQGKEYAETGITINALAPAVIQTPMVDAMPEAQVKYMTDKIPMKRCGTLEEVAAMAAFIVSPENSFSTGFTYDLTGGRAVY
jgi:3-oxoacyl-[acyl-carrier protein] reductase